jgi:hypothetical protein
LGNIPFEDPEKEHIAYAFLASAAVSVESLSLPANSDVPHRLRPFRKGFNLLDSAFIRSILMNLEHIAPKPSVEEWTCAKSDLLRIQLVLLGITGQHASAVVGFEEVQDRSEPSGECMLPPVSQFPEVRGYGDQFDADAVGHDAGSFEGTGVIRVLGFERDVEAQYENARSQSYLLPAGFPLGLRPCGIG